jgi:hypothetical protein
VLGAEIEIKLVVGKFAKGIEIEVVSPEIVRVADGVVRTRPDILSDESDKDSALTDTLDAETLRLVDGADKVGADMEGGERAMVVLGSEIDSEVLEIPRVVTGPVRDGKLILVLMPDTVGPEIDNVDTEADNELRLMLGTETEGTERVPDMVVVETPTLGKVTDSDKLVVGGRLRLIVGVLYTGSNDVVTEYAGMAVGTLVLISVLPAEFKATARWKRSTTVSFPEDGAPLEEPRLLIAVHVPLLYVAA